MSNDETTDNMNKEVAHSEDEKKKLIQVVQKLVLLVVNLKQHPDPHKKIKRKVKAKVKN